MPFDIYNDSADYALRVLKQRFLYDEIEAEVIHHLQKQVQNKSAYHPHDQSSLLPSLWVAMTTSSETQQWVVHKCTIMLLTVWPRRNYYTKAQPGPHG
jgi:hypothetical protein